MRIWLLYRRTDDHVGYDEYAGHVVIAYTEHEARALCPTNGCEVGSSWRTDWTPAQNIWLDERTVCYTIGDASYWQYVTKGAHVVLSSFNAG